MKNKRQEFVTFRTKHNVVQAELTKSYLEAQGVPVVLIRPLLGCSDYGVATIQVPKDRISECESLLREMESPAQVKPA